MRRLSRARIAFLLLLLAGLGGCGGNQPIHIPGSPPKPATIEYNRGIDFYDREDWDTAISCFSKAIRLRPDHANAHITRGLAYHKKKAYDLAIKDYTEAIRLKTRFPAVAYYNRGEAYRDQGEPTKAAADFARAKALKKKK